MRSLHEKGAYAANEVSVLYVPRLYTPGVTRGVVWCHEHGASGASSLGEDAIGFRVLAEEYGIVSVACDLGGPTAWGNDTAIARVSDAWSYLITKTGCKSDKVLMYGGSMGSVTAANWARANPTKVAALCLALPATDLAWLHDNVALDGSNFTAEIDAAYANGFTAAKATHSPNEYASTLTGQFPIKTLISSSDNVVGPDMGRVFAQRSKAEMYEFVGKSPGHSLGPVQPDGTGYNCEWAASWLAQRAV